LQLLANGQVVACAIAAEVLSNNYYAADRFSATVGLRLDRRIDASFWASEVDILLEVRISLDGGSSYTSLIQGEVDNVAIDSTLGLVHLDGRDFTASLIEARTQETFANRTASEIASILAKRHDLTSYVSVTSTPVGRYYQSEHDRITLDQFSRATTEWDLLVFLAQHEGFDVFVAGQSLYFQPTTLAGHLAVSLRPEDVTDLRLERSLTLARDIEVVVKSWNSRQNSAFVQRARASCLGGGSGGSDTAQYYVVVQPNLIPDDALKLAQRKLAELTRHERTVRIAMPGELALSPRSMISLGGTGTDFDQTYYIDVIERRFQPGGGFTQTILATNTSPRTVTPASSDAIGTAA
jgi:phage protein D